MTTFFTSDEHYGHKNIITFDVGPPGQKHKRPFENITEMREELIRRHNDIVGPDDIVYHLGDFSFSRVEEAIQITKRLNGQKYLIWGNHDKELRRSKEFADQWLWCKDQAEIYVGETKVVLNHFPMLAWNRSHHGSYHVHGHCHGSLAPDPGALRLDVGVDCWDYYPVPFEQIKAVMDQKTFKPIDHHGTRGNGH